MTARQNVLFRLVNRNSMRAAYWSVKTMTCLNSLKQVAVILTA